MVPYLLNGFLFFIPVFIGNAVFYKKLPDFYQPEIWDNIPKALDVAENILRYSSFLIPITFRIDFERDAQLWDLLLYIAGILLYFTSWLVQIKFKERTAAKLLLFRMAPAYTTGFWLTGIGLIGSKTFIPRIREVYFPIIISFVIIHTCHSYMIGKKSTAEN